MAAIFSENLQLKDVDRVFDCIIVGAGVRLEITFSVIVLSINTLTTV